MDFSGKFGGSESSWWSCTPGEDYHVYSFSLDRYGKVQPSCLDCRAYGLSVRCVNDPLNDN